MLAREPDWSAVPATTPPRLVALLKRCLEKDPTRRLRDIGDAQLDSVEAPIASSPGRPLAPSWRLAPWALAALMAAALGVLLLRRQPVEAQTVRFAVPAPERTTIGSTAPHNVPAISPDGRRLAFTAVSEGRSMLWVRQLDSLTAEALPGTEAATDNSQVRLPR